MQRLGIALLSALVGLLMIEGFLRLFWPQENMHLYTLRNDNIVFNRPDFSDITAMRPYASLSQMRNFFGLNDPLNPEGAPLYKPYVHINSQGFRDAREEIPLRRAGHLRVLNLGGSIGFGWPDIEENSYIEQLAKKGNGVDVVNCSIIAANAPQLAKIYENICASFDHDWVLMQITLAPNMGVPDYLTMDFWGAEYRIHQALWWTQRLSLTEPRPLARGAASELIEPIDWSKPGVREMVEATYRSRLPLYDESHLIRFVENVFLLSPRRLGSSPAVEGALRIQQSPDFQKHVEEFFANGTHPTLKAIETVREIARKRHAHLVVLLIPNRFELETRHVLVRQDLKWLMNALDSRGIPYISPLEWFPADKWASYYRERDEHPTAQGYEHMAEVIGDRLNRLAPRLK